MEPQKSQAKIFRANGKGKPTLAKAYEKTQPVDWVAFLAGISRGKTVLEYGANRTIFSQGDPADSVWYLQHGRVKLAVTSQQGKERKRSSAFWATANSSARDTWPASPCASQPLMR